MTPRTRLVAVGAAWALAIAVPVDLLAQIADAATAGDEHSPLLWPCAAVILVGMAVGGGVTGAGAQRSGAPGRPAAGLGAAAGLVALAVVLVLGIGRSVAAGHSVRWAAAPFLLALGAVLGSVGAAVGWSRARTSAP
jgi:hypothetical protein